MGGSVVAAQKDRLTAEGVQWNGDRVDLAQSGFDSFSSDRPLEQLRQVQEAIQSQIVLCPRRKMPKWVGAVDVAYPSAEEGMAAYALVETETASLVWSTTIRRRVKFPYIRTYLSFREIPILLDLLEEVRVAGRLAEVLLVDGSGILHQRHAGIASHLGVVESIPTIGITKKLLCGQVDVVGMEPLESRPVLLTQQIAKSFTMHSDQRKRGENNRAVARIGWRPCRPVLLQSDCIGVALRPTAGSLRPIFISPGHQVDLAFAERLVRRLLTGHRLPEPLYWADRLSRSFKDD
jgi:deoxyribonuclease V